ncbi:hypothetical protein [Paraflavitalea sp. CAU 1676]|uniref:ComEC/Rec2 family competence protein n=1 Tax=Paraflavitalea sp. CAU 1676 TaxID=3032598 RepID=UPI0023DC76DB|nr:hypothetical protein [Paraflavitalea sp. CAU 1676]MDF2188320.1 hypothetical protein [Paraflavitalea sp. CAU 1676]
MAFNIHFLPARYGDCIWIEYGNERELKNILIDGGTSGTKVDISGFIETLPLGKRHFELIVVTHVDRDHIEGILALLENDTLGFTISDFWFNGWAQLQEKDESEQFGPDQGERLSAALIKHKIPWNEAFSNAAAFADEADALLTVKLELGLEITILSPYWKHLQKLRPVWEREVRKNGLQPGYGLIDPEIDNEEMESFGPPASPDVEKLNSTKFEEDRGEANGSSIAFIATYNKKSVLLCGDAFPSTVKQSLDRIYKNQAPFELVKLSHHGSKKNTSPDLIEKLLCNKFVISTNGSNYGHPNPEAVAWVIKRSTVPPMLVFNYRSDYNEIWDNTNLKKRYGYTTTYPKEGEVLVVEL